MGHNKLGDICTADKTYRAQETAELCESFLETKTGVPQRAVEYGICYAEGVACTSWWQIDEFKGCHEGALFDDWFRSNFERADECARSLNNIEGGNSKHVERARHNLILKDSYRVTSGQGHKEASVLRKIVSFISDVAGK